MKRFLQAISVKLKLYIHGAMRVGKKAVSLMQRIQLLLVLIYFFTFLGFYIFTGQLGAGLLLFLAGGLLSIVMSLQHRVNFLREWSVLLMIAVSYESLRFLYLATSERFGVANIYAIDRALWGINLTGTLQSLANSNALTPIMTLVYSLHIPLVIIFAFVFWAGKRSFFSLYVTSISICTYIAFLFFLFIPSAPPWYAGIAQNMLSGNNGVSGTYHSLSSIVESDPLAAFPSLHAAYVVTLTLVLFKINRRYGLLFTPVALAVLFSTIYLGQHYVVDLLAGSAIAIISVYVAERIGNVVKL
jgi:membrane-associated phospholipid phosphatase